jgi:hypothetical protein
VAIRAPHFAVSILSITIRQRARVKSVGNVSYTALVWVVLALAGCAGSIVGLQSDGTYVLEKNEHTLSCDAMARNLAERVELLKLLPERARAERMEAPQTAVSLITRWMSSGKKGLAAIEQYDRERAHAYALQRVMHEKQCPPADLDRDLAEADAQIAGIRGK